MRENTGQKNSECKHFSRSELYDGYSYSAILYFLAKYHTISQFLYHSYKESLENVASLEEKTILVWMK